MKEQELHAYGRNQKKTDQRINHRTREEPKEQTTAPEKNQNESKDQTQNSKLPEKLDPWGAHKIECQKEKRVRLWRPKTEEELCP